MYDRANSNKILITGGTGVIGQALVRELASKNIGNLRLAVRDLEKAKLQISKMVNSAYFHSQIEFTESDLTKLTDQEFDALVNGCQWVIHLAGLVHQPEAAEEQYKVFNV